MLLNYIRSGRPGSPDDVAALVLASDQSAWITGVILGVAGEAMTTT